MARHLYLRGCEDKDLQGLLKKLRRDTNKPKMTSCDVVKIQEKICKLETRMTKLHTKKPWSELQQEKFNLLTERWVFLQDELRVAKLSME